MISGIMANSYIITYIQGLTAIEIRIVEEHLSRIQALFDEGEAMEFRLFKLITSRKKERITDNIIASEIGAKRISDLKNNLFNKVLEALTLDKYITNDDLFNENEIINNTLRKKLLVCKVSIRMNNQYKTDAITEILDETILTAKRYEQYDVLLDALYTKKYLKSIRLGNSFFEEISAEINFYKYCLDALLNATDNYLKLVLNENYIKTLTDAELEDHLVKSIKRMRLDYKKTKSEQINYYTHILSFGLAERQKEFDKAIELCNKLLTIVQKSKVVYRKERVGFVHDNLSQYKTYLNKYSEATAESQKAQKYYQENSFSYAKSKEQEFFSNFYDENYQGAKKCVNELLNHSVLDTGEFLKSKFIYYRACVHFMEGEYKEALQLLNESLDIEKDKARWNVSLRITNIMIFIEMNKLNEAVAFLEAMRKYIERTSKTDELGSRNILIVKLLRELEKNGFEYDRQNIIINELLKQLSEKDSSASWKFFSSELIPFHKWISKKFSI